MPRSQTHVPCRHPLVVRVPWLGRARRQLRRYASASRSPTSRGSRPDAVTVFGGKETNRYLLETTGCGVAFFDYDGDGWLDVFLVNGTTLEGFPKGQEPTNHLYRNRGDGTFEDVTRAGGPRRRPAGARACARATTTTTATRTCSSRYCGQNRLYRNRGDGTLRGRHRARRPRATRARAGAPAARSSTTTATAGSTSSSPTTSTSTSTTAPTPDSGLCRYKGMPGGLRAARPAGRQERALPQPRRRHVRGRVGEGRASRSAAGTYGLGVSTLDFDDDGWIDLYVANDSNPSALYRNNRDGTFTDVGGHRRLRLQPGRQAAGRHGRRRRRLRPQRHHGHLQDQLRGRHLDALREHRRGLLRGPHVRRRHRRSTRAGWAGAPASSTSTTTAGSTSSWSTATSIRRSAQLKTEAGYEQRKVVYRNLGERPASRTSPSAWARRSPTPKAGPRRGLRRLRQRRRRGRRGQQRARRAGPLPPDADPAHHWLTREARGHDVEPQRDRRARALRRGRRDAVAGGARRRQLRLAERPARALRPGRGRAASTGSRCAGRTASRRSGATCRPTASTR